MNEISFCYFSNKNLEIILEKIIAITKKLTNVIKDILIVRSLLFVPAQHFSKLITKEKFRPSNHQVLINSLFNSNRI